MAKKTRGKSRAQLERERGDARKRFNKTKNLPLHEATDTFLASVLNTAGVMSFRRKKKTESIIAVAVTGESLDAARAALQRAKSILQMAHGRLTKREQRFRLTSYMDLTVLTALMPQLSHKKADIQILRNEYKHAVQRREAAKARREALS